MVESMFEPKSIQIQDLVIKIKQFLKGYVFVGREGLSRLNHS